MRAVLIVVVAASAAGCGSDAGGVAVRGSVTVDGQPAAAGTVTFVTPAGAVVAGAQVTAGAFEGRCPPGSYRVQVSVPRPYGPPVAGMGGAQQMEEGVDEAFNSRTTLAADVAAGGPPLTLAVRSRPPADKR